MLKSVKDLMEHLVCGEDSGLQVLTLFLWSLNVCNLMIFQFHKFPNVNLFVGIVLYPYTGRSIEVKIFEILLQTDL